MVNDLCWKLIYNIVLKKNTQNDLKLACLDMRLDLRLEGNDLRIT